MSRLAVLLLAAFPLFGAGVTLSGRVVDESDVPVRDARITVQPGALQTQTDPTGAFTLTLPAPGDYTIDVQAEGFYALTNRAVHVETSQELTLAVNAVREVFQSVDVNEQPSPVDVAQTHNDERLTGTEINGILYPNSHSLRNSMKLMPGVVEDPSGKLHVNGSSENQVLYLLNGFNLTDPITGQFRTLLAVDAVRTLDLSTSRYSPEFGKGSAGVLAIGAETGTDAFHYTATNFLPGLSVQQGLHLANWYPRVGFSGPIMRGRAWFSDSFDSEYNQALVPGLPSGQNTRRGWAGSNLLHSQVNLTPSNILFGDFLVNIDNEGRVGLGPLDPVSTTSTVHTREYFASIKDQVSLGHAALIEFGYGHNNFSDAQTPQGRSLYILAPTGRSGNYFVDSDQTAARDQGLVHAYLPRFELAGSHQFEAGADADLLHYNANLQRTGYQVLGLSGQILSETLFQGAGVFHLRDVEMSSYVLDTWRLAKRLQINAGVRQDWDQRIGDLAWSPRAAFSWAPWVSGRTRISVGYAITHDAVTMQMLGRPLDQTAVTTNAAGPATLTTFLPLFGGLKLPRASNWSAAVDHQIAARLYGTVKYLRRRGTDGFAFLNTLAPDAPPSLLPLPNAATGGAYQLTNLRRDDYDAVEIMVRQTFSGQYEWMASYTHSRAVSNALLDVNTAEPLQVLPEMVAMPWDSPNRVLGWAYLPLFRKNWSIAALADLRTGFPFSIRDQNGVISGTVDSHRYPLNFDLNIAIERMVTFRGYRFAVRLGADNITGQQNPTAVNNVTGTPQFLQFAGNEGRHAVVRIRFFGRAGTK